MEKDTWKLGGGDELVGVNLRREWSISKKYQYVGQLIEKSATM